MPWTFYNSNGQRLSSAATNISVLDIDGATDIGAAIVDADLFIIDDGAGGTNRKTEASRLKTYVGSAVTREGGDIGEETATSGSVATVSSAASISILAAETAIVRFSARKTTGAVESGTCGAKIYADATTTICSPTTASTTQFPWGSADTNVAQNGPGGFHISGRGSNYLNSSAGTVLAGYAPVGGGSSSSFAGQKMNIDDDYPAGTITRIDILCIGGGTITVGTDFLNVYSFTGS
tara:strand:+ start:258 stop:965 length:708 start_codon:yes stop_codon:yes gene_type:complete